MIAAQSSALRSQPPPQPDDHVQHSPPPQDSDWDQELEDVMKEATPMESSFLPGTPPSKKVGRFFLFSHRKNYPHAPTPPLTTPIAHLHHYPHPSPSPPPSFPISTSLPPPSPQFKPLSVLFGMDMFGEKTDDSDILAPDSDSDS